MFGVHLLFRRQIYCKTLELCFLSILLLLLFICHISIVPWLMFGIVSLMNNFLVPGAAFVAALQEALLTRCLLPFEAENNL